MSLEPAPTSPGTKPPPLNAEELIRKIVEWSTIARKQGLLGLEPLIERLELGTPRPGDRDDVAPTVVGILGALDQAGANQRIDRAADRGLAAAKGGDALVSFCLEGNEIFRITVRRENRSTNVPAIGDISE